MRKTALSILLALFALLLASWLAPPIERDTSLGTARFEVDPALRGGGSLYVPVADWGISFPLHASPFLLRSEVRNINREGLLAAASGNETVLRAAEREIRDGALSSLWRVWLLGILLAASLALLLSKLFGTRRIERRSALSATLLGGVLFLFALLTHSSDALQKPSFYARGEELSQILDALSAEGPRGSYEDNFREVIADVSGFLSKGAPKEGSKEAVLASDLHSNALAFSALGDFAENKPLFFVGDFGLEGNDAEAALLAPEIAALSSRVLAVSGNHDSTSLMQRLAQSGVEVLGRRGTLQANGTWKAGVARVLGMSVRGWDDPLEWQGETADPSRRYSFQDAEAENTAKKDLWTWWKGLSEKPDLLLIHQPALAEHLALKLAKYPRPLTILVGHDHDQWIAQSANVRIVDAGSVGAGGIFGLGREMAELAELRFRANALSSADMIAVSPLDGRASAERVLPKEVCSLPCRYRIRPIR